MFKARKYSFNLLFCTVAIGLLTMVACKQRSRTIMDEFKRVDSSLQVTTPPGDSTGSLHAITLLADSMRLLHMQILAKQQANPPLAVVADSLFVITSYAISYIDSLEEELHKLDPTGETTAATNKVFKADATGRLLYRHLLQVRAYAGKAIVTKSKLAQANDILAVVADVGDDKAFMKKFFGNEPAVAAMTILLYLRNRCNDAAVFALADIYEAITKTR